MQGIFLAQNSEVPTAGLKPHYRRPITTEWLRWVQADLVDRIKHPRPQRENETKANYEMIIENDQQDTTNLLRLVTWELSRRNGEL